MSTSAPLARDLSTALAAGGPATASAIDRLRRNLLAARDHTDALFSLVRPEHLYERPIAERHRLVFYVGHLEAFDRNLFAAELSPSNVASELDRLFAFGIDPVDGQLPRDTPADWPSLKHICAYRDHTRSTVDALLSSHSTPSARWMTLLHAAIEHRLMHAETLSYLLHQLPFDYKRGFVTPVCEDLLPASPDRIDVTAGAAILGLVEEVGDFGWDNERPASTVEVPAFTIDRHKVSNRNYLQFINEGGYDERAFWSEEDWAWRRANAIEHPAFWIREKRGDWLWKSMFDPLPLPLDAPVYVSHAEASAYARWAGRRLPSEAQWQRAAFGDSAHDISVAVLADPKRFDPLCVHSRSLLPSISGAIGMRGNGWEWTRTPFAPLPGFAAFDFYRGYSEPFFDGKHFVLKGGSPRTAPCLMRPSFRNWFQPHYPYVYAGFRLVDDEQGSDR